MKDLAYFRNKIRAMNFIPMTDDELQIVIRKDEKAVDNARLEGLYETPEEKEFFQLLIDERLPLNLRKDLVREWVLSNL